MHPVELRDPKGGPPLVLRPCWEIWWAIEERHGGNIGALYDDVRSLRVSLRLAADLIWRCARHGGATELTHAQVCEWIYALGYFEVVDAVLELWRDLAKPQTLDDELVAAREPEGDADDPLAEGGSEPSGTT